MFAKFYQSELTYLREMGREFAAAHPSSAGLLSERSDDPDVERLLEGFAFLSARIRERVDDAVPEVVHGLAELLLPQYLRPLPATSIIEFKPQIKALRGVRSVPRGRAVGSNPVEGTSCQFQTCYDVDLLPLELLSVDHDESLANRPALRIKLKTTEAGRAIVAREEGIRFFLAGEYSLAATLHLWLLRHCTGVEIRSSEDRSVPRSDPMRTLRREQIKPVGLRESEAVMPWPKFAPEGSRFVQEYFSLPSKYLFIDVLGLEGLEFPGDYIEFSFLFERPPDLPSPVTDDSFRLHCTPVINIFDVSAEPVKLDPLVPDHLIRAAGVNPAHMEVYDVSTVIGVRPGRGNRRSYSNFYSFAHTRPDSDYDGYYVLRRARSPLDEATDTYIGVARPKDRNRGGVEAVDEDETLSIELLCTNRALTNELAIGDICKPVRGSSVPPFSNITAVSPPVRAPLAGELQWRLLAHLALNRQRVTQPETLKLMLSLYNFLAGSGSPAGRANEMRVEAIRTTEFEAVTRMLEGAPVRGAATTIELDETRFASIGDAHLFGIVLDELLATYCSINSFHELRVRLHPSKIEFRWEPRNGYHRIL
ncbi:type VI secretion system baseplate subunit TssF [Pseudenhygromyxa sp. WMMC2535]|uniref:type VI secretion system baseplate subunit TssF n=1 Tax=Pseudenhygromyxa sp. WMMC2535 TaxID=2712867 RepID=UPI00155651C4|nr:type VI secretion system baseplate subunit TssF [Pseudenhygromyxa sp. WMMC2535]NVB36787.1 type VI secretion system baseplate subunit TssF [Pseudenhygromyxa sp. WMMC2535]